MAAATAEGQANSRSSGAPATVVEVGETTGTEWLGLVRDGERWRLPVGESVISGASALFGGCATAAAIAVAQSLVPHPCVWASTHFGSLAKLGTEVELSAEVISSGRTVSHVAVRGATTDGESFTARVTAGERPEHAVQGDWLPRPAVVAPDRASPFDHPVHRSTWAERFTWRLAGRGDAASGSPWAAWWVRPVQDVDPVSVAAVLCDYVTYGVGRALGESMGGLSVDNVLRVHRPRCAPGDGWYLLDVRPQSISGGFGFGTAQLFAGDELVAMGSQTIVANSWDWRLPEER